MNISKKFLALLLIAFVAGVIGAAAYTTWQGSITWQIAKEFTVWDAETGGNLLTTYTEDLGELEEPYPTITRLLWLQNEADVQITVTVIQTGSGWTGGFDGPYDIPAGLTRVLATLTLTITGSGSYQFDFTIA